MHRVPTGCLTSGDTFVIGLARCRVSVLFSVVRHEDDRLQTYIRPQRANMESRASGATQLHGLLDHVSYRLYPDGRTDRLCHDTLNASACRSAGPPGCELLFVVLFKPRLSLRDFHRKSARGARQPTRCAPSCLRARRRLCCGGPCRRVPVPTSGGGILACSRSRFGSPH
jgi:hypothetical protein